MKMLRIGSVGLLAISLTACGQSSGDNEGGDESKAEAAVVETEITAADATAILADGKPWKMVAGDGKNADIVLRADKSGALQGPITLDIEWAEQDGKFCLLMGKMLGDQCMDMKKIPNGFRGYKDGAMRVSFTR
jgi:hypothetical protein